MEQSKHITKEEIKSDQFAEVVLNAYELLKENLKAVLIAAAIIIVAVGGFFLYRYQQQKDQAESFLKYTQAVEKYQEAESDWLDPAKTEKSGEQLQAVATQFQTIFQKYPGTAVADKARYNYAKILYYQGNYDGAIAKFQEVIGKRLAENDILALYAQKAIGNCYEQKGDYQGAIKAYTLPEGKLSPKFPMAMREQAKVDFQFSQGRCYEKLGQLNEALAIYKDLIDLFRLNLEKAIGQKSLELLPKAKSLIAALPKPPAMTEAEKLERENNYYNAFDAYAKAIHSYKVERDIHGGLTKELRERIYRFETTANDFLKNLREARRTESEGRNSTALYYYGQAIDLDFAPSRSLYEKALLYHDQIQRNQK